MKITLHPDEEIVALGVRHWLPLVGFVLAIILLGVAPIIGTELLKSHNQSFFAWATIYENHLAILEACWILWLLMGFAVTWTNHYLDVLVVTSKRLIDIDQLSLFHRDIAEVRIENIEDIQIVVPGFLASWLGYGTLKIQTAGEDVEFMVRNLRDPETLKQTISAIEDRVRSKIPREV